MECHKNVLEKLDDYMKEMELVHNSKRQFPETMAQLQEACNINKKIMGMMNTLAQQCMSGFSKNILQVTIYSIRKSHKSLCKSKPTKLIREFLGAGECINSGRKLFRKCIDRLKKVLLSLKHVESKKRVPLICCEMVRTKHCLLEQSKKVPQCTEKHLEVLQNHYSHVSGNSINMACGDYNEDSDKCSNIHLPSYALLDHSNQGPKSLMMAALELLSLFENDPELQIN